MENKKIKILEKPYDFKDKDSGRQITGHNYWLVVETPLGSVEFKIVAPSQIEKTILKDISKPF